MRSSRIARAFVFDLVREFVKKTIMAGVSLVALMAAMQVEAKGLEGFYVGAKVGDNDSTVSGVPNPGLGNAFVGGEAGYNYVVDGLLLGVDVWGDGHRTAVTGRDWGVDLKLGSVRENTLYYAKLGVAKTYPGARAHYGVGAEYKFADSWGALAELTYDSKTVNGAAYTNMNYVVGVTYHF